MVGPGVLPLLHVELLAVPDEVADGLHDRSVTSGKTTIKAAAAKKCCFFFFYWTIEKYPWWSETFAKKKHNTFISLPLEVWPQTYSFRYRFFQTTLWSESLMHYFPKEEETCILNVYDHHEYFFAAWLCSKVSHINRKSTRGCTENLANSILSTWNCLFGYTIYYQTLFSINYAKKIPEILYKKSAKNCTQICQIRYRSLYSNRFLVCGDLDPCDGVPLHVHDHDVPLCRADIHLQQIQL